MNKRSILLLAILALAAAAFIGYRMYNAKPAGASEKKADVSVTAESLLQAFTADEVAAGAQYNDKVVQVSGVVREVATDPNGPTTVYLETSEAIASVACEFAPDALPSNVKKGDAIVLKGFCAGFNMDVLLQRCSIVE